MLTIEAHAKINLTLEVLGKRADGYHEIRSVIQALKLHDTLCFEDDNILSFYCSYPLWDAEKSLVTQTARALQQRFDVKRGARISLEKRIPLSSGLGGDSSDAAAVITGLNRLWGLEMSSIQLAQFAATLGSDVPFFLNGPTAVTSGRGEVITPLSPPQRNRVVLMLPEVQHKESKTGYMYSLLKHDSYSTGAITGILAEYLRSGHVLAPGDVDNVFERVALEGFAGLEPYWREFREVSGAPVHLAGAGPTLFALFDDGEQALMVVRELKNRGFEVILTETLGDK